MVDLVHRSVQNLLRKARNLRRIPAPEGEAGKRAEKRDLSRPKEEHSVLQMISEAVGQCTVVFMVSKFFGTIFP